MALRAIETSGTVSALRGRGVPFRVSPEKVAVPDPPAGVLSRPHLERRCDPAQRRVTVLIGAGGFGKTTVMAASCRRAAERGDRVIWLSIDEHDDAQRVVAHLAYAAELPWDTDVPGAGSVGQPEMHYLDGLLAAIRADSRPCIVAFDELDRVPSGGAHIIDYLIWRGPANLHLAVACRQLPRLIDIATPVAEGRGVLVGPDELRFTRPEFGTFIGGVLPRERLRAMWEDSQGWPIAVCLRRNLADTDEADVTDLSSNWVGSRLMRGVAESDRRFLLEAACFEWADADMLDAVLGAGSAERLRRLGILRGLVQGIDGGSAFRLHALVRRYAEQELHRVGDDGDLRRRIAVELSARGRTVDAMRQALEAKDGTLAGQILEGAGACRLAFVAGMQSLHDAVALLPDDVIRKFPRLRLARLAASAMDGRTFGDELTGDLLPLVTGSGEGPSDGDPDLLIDTLLVRGIFLMCGCAPIGSDAVATTLAGVERAMAQMEVDPAVAGAVAYGQAIHQYEASDLKTALATARRVRDYAATCPSIALSASILEGTILFSAGDVAAADAVLMQAHRQAQRDFPGHHSPEMIGDAFAAEVALETNRPVAAGRRLPAFVGLTSVGAWLDVYAAVVDVGIELAVRRDAPTRVGSLLREAWEFARSRNMWTLCRWLAAVRVSALLRDGRLDDAEALWRETGLPTDIDAQVDLSYQSWREMEAVCCAWVELLLVREDHAQALVLARSFVARAREKDLARTESRATAWAMHAAWLVGDTVAAEEFLKANLRLFRRTGFSRALTSMPESTRAMLERLDTGDSDLNAARDAVRALIAAPEPGPSDVSLTEREREILARLPIHRDKEIARSLGLTDNGVRYHVKKIFTKLGVTNRRDAVRKAEALGISPAADHQ